MTDSEIWRDIPGFEGQYQASTLGRIRSLDRHVPRQAPGRKLHYVLRYGYILRQTDNGHGYLQVGLGAKCKSYKVHNLIALTFLGRRPLGADVRHLDGNRYNNRLENLMYGTRAENNRDIYAIGHKQHAFTTEQVRLIRKRLSHGERICDLAREYSVDRNTISRIKNRRTFIWL